MNQRQPEGGASAVEFALLMPVFVLIIAAILDFGFMFAQQVSLNNAARDSSRQGVVKPLSGSALKCFEVVDKARTALGTTIGISANTNVAVNVDGSNDCNAPANGSTAVATLPCASGGSGQQLTVTLTYTSQTPVPLPYLNNKVLTAQGVFQCEYS